MNSENILIAVIVVIVIIIVCLSYFFYSKYRKQQLEIELLLKKYQELSMATPTTQTALADTITSELNNVYKRLPNTPKSVQTEEKTFSLEDCIDCELEPFEAKSSAK
jgi:uncharacterized protein YpmS